MINILIPLGGKSSFFDNSEYIYPKPLIEIKGKSMIEMVIDNLNQIKERKKFIFILNKVDCKSFYIDNVVKLLTDEQCSIIRLDSETKGAACSCLLAVDNIDNEEELIISNSDQIINHDLNEIISFFNKNNCDAGVVCFDSIHPRWSFVRIDGNNLISETAEKRPISKNAIAGLYYFKKGSYFVKAAMNSIRKGASVNGVFFIAPVLNEMILDNNRLMIYKISNDEYHTFYSPAKISEYENSFISRI